MLPRIAQHVLQIPDVGIKPKTLSNYKSILMNKIQSHRSNSILFFNLHSSESTNLGCKIVSLLNGDEKEEKEIELRRKELGFIEKRKKMTFLQSSPLLTNSDSLFFFFFATTKFKCLHKQGLLSIYRFLFLHPKQSPKTKSQNT